MRLFLACPILPEDQKQLSDWWSDHLAGYPGHWVPPENFHVTIAFLGEREDSEVQDLIALIDEHLDARELPIQWRLNRFSHFRNGVVYLTGFNPPGPLPKWAEALAFLVPLADKHPNYIPHITMGRRVESPPIQEPDILVTLDRVSLFQSQTTESGVHYHELHHWRAKPS